MHQFTDYLSQPVNVGDVIAYPTASGSSSAEMNLAVILALDEIIPNNPSDPKDRSGYMHKDRNKPHPPSRDIIGKWVKRNGDRYGDYERDDSKAYILTVHKIMRDAGHRYTVNQERKVSLKNVDRVIVVSDKISPSILVTEVV